jgi:hypothetical protein
MAEHAEQDKGQEVVEQLVDKHMVEDVSTQDETVLSHEVRLLQTQCEAVYDDFSSDPRPVELPAQY